MFVTPVEFVREIFLFKISQDSRFPPLHKSILA